MRLIAHLSPGVQGSAAQGDLDRTISSMKAMFWLWMTIVVVGLVTMFVLVAMGR